MCTIRGRESRALAAAGVVFVSYWLAACQNSTPNESVRVGDFVVSARLVPDPPTTGDNRLVVALKDAQGQPVDGDSGLRRLNACDGSDGGDAERGPRPRSGRRCLRRHFFYPGNRRLDSRSSYLRTGTCSR